MISDSGHLLIMDSDTLLLVHAVPLLVIGSDFLLLSDLLHMEMFGVGSLRVVNFVLYPNLNCW